MQLQTASVLAQYMPYPPTSSKAKHTYANIVCRPAGKSFIERRRRVVGGRRQGWSRDVTADIVADTYQVLTIFVLFLS